MRTLSYAPRSYFESGLSMTIALENGLKNQPARRSHFWAREYRYAEYHHAPRSDPLSRPPFLARPLPSAYPALFFCLPTEGNQRQRRRIPGSYFEPGFRARKSARIPGAKRNSLFWVGDVGLFSGPESGSKIRPGMGRKLAGGGSLAVVEFPPRPGGGRQSSAED